MKTSRTSPERTCPEKLAVMSALSLLSTGALLGWNENGIRSDLIPACAASLLLALSLIGTMRRIDRVVWITLAATALLAIFNANSHREGISWALAGVAFLAGSHARFDDQNRRVILAGSMILLALALYQRVVLFPWMLERIEGLGRDRLVSGRIFSAFMLPAQYSAYLAIVLPLAVASARTDRFRFTARCIAFLLPVGFVLAGSLSGVVAAVIALGYLQGSYRRLSGMHLLLGAALVTVLILRHDALVLSASSYLLRINTWKATIAGATDAIWFGHGSDSFETLFMRRYWIEGADKVRHPHSWPLKVLFENGLAGLTLWAAAASSLFTRVRDRSFRAAAAAFFVASLLDVADLSMTLRSLAFFLLGASVMKRSAEEPPPPR